MWRNLKTGMASEHLELLHALFREIFSQEILRVASVSGGDIAEAFQVSLTKREIFVKLMPDENTLNAELLGLQSIAETNTIAVPETFGVHPLGTCFVLLMEFLPSRPAAPADMASLGSHLAALHLSTASFFGFQKDNFIGRLSQKNTPAETWSEFYARQRLMPQFELAKTNGFLEYIPSLEKMVACMNPLFTEVKPALLHGDLWSGNYLIHQNGTPYLIDPATYYGHHEVDLAMSRLFGGFGPTFYDTYHQLIPQAKGWQQRQDLYQLYYLLVHLNLFGISYAPSVIHLTERYFH